MPRLAPLLLAPFAAAGCAAADPLPRTDYETFLTLRAERRFALQDPGSAVPLPAQPPDLPVPRGFVLLGASAPLSQTLAGRTARLRYGGLAGATAGNASARPVEATAAFFRGVLPALGWRPAGSEEATRRVRLLFHNEREEAILDIHEDGPASFVLVEMELRPARGGPS